MKLEKRFYKNALHNVKDYKNYLALANDTFDIDYTEELNDLLDLEFKLANAYINDYIAIWLNDKETNLLEEATDYAIDILETKRYILLTAKEYIKGMEVK